MLKVYKNKLNIRVELYFKDIRLKNTHTPTFLVGQTHTHTPTHIIPSPCWQ